MGNFKKQRDFVEYLALVSQLGLTMGGSILLCFFVGLLLDRWVGGGGIFLVVFILIGVVGGAFTVYRQIDKLSKE